MSREEKTGVLIAAPSSTEIVFKLPNGKIEKLLCSDTLWNRDPTINEMTAKLISAGLNNNQPYVVRITIEDGIVIRLKKTR